LAFGSSFGGGFAGVGRPLRPSAKDALYLTFLVPAALYTFHNLLGHTQIYRSIVGISTVVLVNNSGSALNNVEIEMWAPNHHYTYRFSSLRQQERERFAFWVSELAVSRIKFSLGSQSVASANLARAKRGQILTVRINPFGQIGHEID
jgi:hypothetical protein